MIEVKITYKEILNLPPKNFSYRVHLLFLDRLKQAGMPIKGTVWYAGITSGMLETFDDKFNHCVIYRWYNDEEVKMKVQERQEAI